MHTCLLHSFQDMCFLSAAAPALRLVFGWQAGRICCIEPGRSLAVDGDTKHDQVGGRLQRRLAPSPVLPVTTWPIASLNRWTIASCLASHSSRQRNDRSIRGPWTAAAAAAAVSSEWSHGGRRLH